ncbi:MAG: hypothetical protein QGG05_20885, partial [Candidatus Latescibacteria bacterium]|nr:hypothetical protein [Candidatus Latescibacterota bacterium]
MADAPSRGSNNWGDGGSPDSVIGAAALGLSVFGGFSRFDVLIVAVLALVILAPQEYRRAVWGVPFARRAIQVSAVVALLWRCLPLVQRPRSTLDPYHAWFVLNELLSVVGGRFPGFDFVAQYSSGLGYAFWVFDLVVPLGV